MYGISDPEDKLHIMNSLIKECIDRHAPLKRTKITRPSAPWLKDPDIVKAKAKRDLLQKNAPKDKNDDEWQKFRDVKNRLKQSIKKAKREFTKKLLSSKKSKDVWKVIHRILHPNPKRLTIDPDKLNEYFSSTAERTVGLKPTEEEQHSKIEETIANLPIDNDTTFDIRPVCYGEVLNELHSLRSDCSTGPDDIPAKLLKLVAEYVTSPLTNIINSLLVNRQFPSAWKVACICAIPQGNEVWSEQDLRPISILPVMSKVYERLIFRQINAFIEEHLIINSNIPAYRKGQSIITVRQAIRDDVIKATRRGEVTIMVLADFAKAFATIQFSNLIIKMSKLGFSKQFLKWTLSFVTDRRTFFQIDDTISNMTAVKFGVPQASILGPVLLNFYVADLQSELSTKGCKYADDTTLYMHAKPKDLEFLQTTISDTLSQLSDWSDRSSLALNSVKTSSCSFLQERFLPNTALEISNPKSTLKGRN